MLNIIKRYEDDLLSSINEINAARFNAIQAADPQWWRLISSYFTLDGDGTYSGANILELVDQSGDSYYYQLLRRAQGTAVGPGCRHPAHGPYLVLHCQQRRRAADLRGSRRQRATNCFGRTKCAVGHPYLTVNRSATV